VSQRPIRVLVVEGSDAVRRALHAYLALAPEVDLVGDASDEAEARARVEHLRPDVVVLDAEMRHLDALATARVLRTTSPTTAVVIHALDSDALAGQGSARVVGKHEGVRALLEAVRAAARDQTP
jgi:chemotaxis response regulator CheB